MDRSTLNKLKKGQMPSIESGSTKVTQSDVSKKAQDFTKKVNEKNPNLYQLLLSWQGYYFH